MAGPRLIIMVSRGSGAFQSVEDVLLQALESKDAEAAWLKLNAREACDSIMAFRIQPLSEILARPALPVSQSIQAGLGNNAASMEVAATM